MPCTSVEAAEAAVADAAQERTALQGSLEARDMELALQKERASQAEGQAATLVASHTQALEVHRQELQAAHAEELSQRLGGAVAEHEAALAELRAAHIESHAALTDEAKTQAEEHEKAAERHEAETERRQEALREALEAEHAKGKEVLTLAQERDALVAEKASVQSQLDSQATKYVELEWKYHAVRDLLHEYYEQTEETKDNHVT